MRAAAGRGLTMPQIIHNILGSGLVRICCPYRACLHVLVGRPCQTDRFQCRCGRNGAFRTGARLAFQHRHIIVQIGGSLLIIFNRWTWLGAGALAVLTALTIPLAHNFWAMVEPVRTMEFYVVIEHITVIGALTVVACASVCKT